MIITRPLRQGLRKLPPQLDSKGGEGRQQLQAELVEGYLLEEAEGEGDPGDPRDPRPK